MDGIEVDVIPGMLRLMMLLLCDIKNIATIPMVDMVDWKKDIQLYYVSRRSKFLYAIEERRFYL